MTRQSTRQQIILSAWGWFATLGTCFALSPLVSQSRYLFVAGILLGLAVAAGTGLRMTRLPRALISGAQLALAIELMVLAFTDELLPGVQAYETLASRFAAFGENAQQYTAPLPADADTTMAFAAIVLGVGLVIDFVGVTLRRVPVLGLLLLLVYMVPVAHMGGQVSTFSFLPGAVGFVFMLAADERERLTHWGRQIRSVDAMWQSGDVELDDAMMTRSRLRICFGAVAIAAVVPLLLPSVDPRILFDGGSGDPTESGSGPIRVDDPSLDMRRNLAQPSNDVLMRVSSEREPSYFRLAALDEFTGEVWKVGARPDEIAVSTDDRLPLPFGGSSAVTERVQYEVELTEHLDSSWLPTTYIPRGIDIETSWLVDPVNFDVRADGTDDITGVSYDLMSSLPSPTLDELKSSPAPGTDWEPFLRLPPAMPAIISQTAKAATAGKRTPIERAQALQEWFRSEGEYTYSLEQVAGDRNRSGLDAVQAFLEEKVGYCEQYASAMALMGRQLGIPSRVVVGFARPEAAGQGVWEFRGEDMHSWPELYFEEAGWIRFEPTPPSVSGDAPPYGETDTNTATPRPRETESVVAPPAAPERPSDTSASGSGADDGYRGWVFALMVSAALALVLSGPRLLRAARARRRWQNAVQPQALAEAAWSELRDCAVDLRIAWVEGATPRHAGRSLRGHLASGATRDVVKALNQIVVTVEQSRFARSVTEATDLRQATELVCEALAEQCSGRQQRLAVWLPASLWRTPARPGGSNRASTGPQHDSVLTLGG